MTSGTGFPRSSTARLLSGLDATTSRCSRLSVAAVDHPVLIQVRLREVHRVHGRPRPPTRRCHQVDRHGRLAQPRLFLVSSPRSEERVRRRNAATIHDMALQNKTNAEIMMACGVLCSKDIFQNALRHARADIRADQSRALRDAAAKSPLWSSEVHLTVRNVFTKRFS